jgi:hypothetical protein
LEILLSQIVVHEVHHKVEGLGEQLQFVMYFNYPLNGLSSFQLANVDRSITVISQRRRLLYLHVAEDLREVLGYVLACLDNVFG